MSNGEEMKAISIRQPWAWLVHAAKGMLGFFECDEASVGSCAP
jgi:hypothetical protein